MNTKTIISGMIATAMLLGTTGAHAREGVIKFRGPNAAATAAKGPNGGAVVRGRGAVKNDDGSVTTGSAAAVRGPNGATGARGSTTTANPDGSLTHQGGMAASGAQGTVSSTGSSARAADGTWTGSRTTNATSNATGNSYTGTTTIDPVTGKPVHSATCTSAAGDIIACPR